VRQNLITEFGDKYTSTGRCFQIGLILKNYAGFAYTFLAVGVDTDGAVFCCSSRVIATLLLFTGFKRLEQVYSNYSVRGIFCS
jgi:hypothetical protein